MILELSDLIIEEASKIFSSELQSVSKGHCARIDGVSMLDAIPLTKKLRDMLPNFEVHALGASNIDFGVSIDKAVELRNRKEHSLLLICPNSEGSGDNSSLDNSFDRTQLRDLLRNVAANFEDVLGGSGISR